MSDALRTLLEDLIRIDSVNPSLVPGARGEAELARWVASWGRGHGLEVHEVADPPDRPSVVLRVPGTGGGATLMLYAHLDTVGVDGMEAPFRPVERDGWLYGRGAVDMKAGLAACLEALAAAAGADLRGDVLLAAVADEEHASVGMEAVLRRFAADGAIVTEPTDLQVHVAHRGFAVFRVETRGVASHTSQPGRGVNAVGHMGRVLAQVERWQADLASARPHSLLGHGSVQPVTVQGGEQLFVTPARCALAVERRTLPGDTPASLEGELAEALQRAGEGVPGFDAASRLDLYRPAFEVPRDAGIVETVRSAATDVLGAEPPLAGAPYWMDAALLAEAGIPTVVFGPRGEGLHAADERVELRSVTACRSVLVEAIRAFCA